MVVRRNLELRHSTVHPWFTKCYPVSRKEKKIIPLPEKRVGIKPTDITFHLYNFIKGPYVII